MTHNKYFFSGRLESVRKDPEGGNQPQEFVPEGVASGPHASDSAATTHNAIVASSTGAMHVYRDTQLVWAAKARLRCTGVQHVILLALMAFAPTIGPAREIQRPRIANQ